jgi:hypothetical protein
MGFRPFLTTDSTKLGQVRLLRITAAGAETVGPPLPLGGEGDNNQVHINMPRVVVHENEPWVLHSGIIWRLDSNSNQWNNEYRLADFSGFLSQQSNNAGLYKTMISGIVHFVTAYPTASSTTWRGVKFNTRTRQWTESMTMNGTRVLSNDSTVVAEMWKNRLYWSHGPVNPLEGILSYYDPVTNACTQVFTASTFRIQMADSCIYKGRLIIIGPISGNNSSLRVWEASDTAINARITLTDVCDRIDNGYKPGCFTDGDFLYIIFQTTTSLRCVKVSVDGNGNWSSLDISNTVLPVVQLRTGSSVNPCVRIIVDPHNTISPPDIYIGLTWKINAALTLSWGNQLDVYKWNGPNSKMTLVNSCGLSSCWVVGDKQGAGQRTFTPGKVDAQVESLTRTGTQGDVTVGYRIIESYLYPSGTPCSISFLCAINSQQSVENTAVLRAATASEGTVTTSNTITGLTTGSGVLRTVVWRAGLQGAIPSGWQRIVPLVEIS